MGLKGSRALEALMDKAAFEIRMGTPSDIASQGLWDACAEALEGSEVLEEERDELQKEVEEYETAVRELRDRAGALVGEDKDKSDPEPSDLDSVFDLLKEEIDRLNASAQDKDARIKALEAELESLARRTEQAEQAEAAAARGRDEVRDRLDASEARIRELEHTVAGGTAAYRDRAEYLEAGLGRLLVEAYKLRKGVL